MRRFAAGFFQITSRKEIVAKLEDGCGFPMIQQPVIAEGRRYLMLDDVSVYSVTHSDPASAKAPRVL